MTAPLPDAGRTVSPLTWRRSLVLLGVLLVASVVLIGAAAVVARLAGVPPLPLIAWLAPGHALVMIAAIALLLRHWRLRFEDLGFRPPTARLLHLVWQVPLMLVLLVLVQGAATALIGTSRGDDTIGRLVQGDASGLVPVVAVGVVVLVPVWEEAVFRGVIRGGLLRRFPGWFAVVASALLFAGAHAVPLLLPYLFTAGVCLALLVRFHGTLWASVIAHGALNGVVLLVTLQALAGR